MEDKVDILNTNTAEVTNQKHCQGSGWKIDGSAGDMEEDIQGWKKCLSQAGDAKTSMRIEFASVQPNRGRLGLSTDDAYLIQEVPGQTRDDAMGELVSPIRPPEEFESSHIEDCSRISIKELPNSDSRHMALYQKRGKGRMARNRAISFGRLFKPWKWKKKEGRVKQQQHQTPAMHEVSTLVETKDLKANSRLTAEDPEEPPKSFSSNKNKALMIDLEKKLATKNAEANGVKYYEESCSMFLPPRDSSNEDLKNNYSTECICDMEGKATKVKNSMSFPSVTNMASTENGSISRPQSLTGENVSKIGNKRSTRWLLCYPSGGTNGSDSPSPRSESANSNASTPSPTDHGFKMPNSYSNERPTSLPVALLNTTSRTLDESEMLNPLAIDPNERVTPQHRLPTAHLIDPHSCTAAVHLDNSSFISSETCVDDNSTTTDDMNIITLEDVGLIPPPPMFGGPSKSCMGLEKSKDADLSSYMKPIFEDDTVVTLACLEENINDEDYINNSTDENACGDASGINSQYPIHQGRETVNSSGINTQHATLVENGTRIIQVG